MSFLCMLYISSAIKLLSQLIEKVFFILLMTAPANNVSSRLKRFFHAEHARITYLFDLIRCSHTAEMLGKEPVITFTAPLSNAMCSKRVPFVVVSNSILF